MKCTNKNKDVNAQRQSEIKVLQGGVVEGIAQPLDKVRIWFRAWSEDDLTKSFGRGDPSRHLQNLGERFFTQGDQHFYIHGFSLPLTCLFVPGTYLFSFASGDEGTFFDVGIASLLSVSITPRQSNWRWCNRCQELFYDDPNQGVCPAGGTHNKTGGGNYVLAIG